MNLEKVETEKMWKLTEIMNLVKVETNRKIVETNRKIVETNRKNVETNRKNVETDRNYEFIKSGNGQKKCGN